MNPMQSKMARVALEWGVRDLAREAGVSADTVARFERGEPLRDRTADQLKAAFIVAGIEFIPENGGGFGVRMRKNISNELL
jgi:transcriptional regulator with XRE-family HTH domain